MWTIERIRTLLHSSDKAVERAIVAIHERQTRDEQATSCTRHSNQRGFRANHASKGSYYARWIAKGRKLTGRHLDNARQIALQYTRQLLEVAQEKDIDRQETERETRKEHMITGHDRVEPLPGTYASIARMLADSGMMTGDEADRWKDEMKDRD